MRILITNDDGINAPGLAALADIAAEIAGPDGEVWTVAPAFEQSGVGHCISYSHPTLVAEMGPRRFAAEGSPADCVLAAIWGIMADSPPDLILSGVNRGNNSAENAMYSGTLGGAMEGALQGFKSVALSQFYGPGNAQLEDAFESARQLGAAVVHSLLEHGFADQDGYKTFYNVNFPPLPAADTKGARVAAQGYRGHGRFRAAPQDAPNGRRYLWVHGSPQAQASGPGTDATANLEGYISVTPMRADLTDHAALDPLAEALGS